MKQKKMTKAELKIDWLNWFRLQVRMSTEARLKGDIQEALNRDRTVERYYQDRAVHGYSEDELFEIESDIRNEMK
jgi:hypothetical protein